MNARGVAVALLQEAGSNPQFTNAHWAFIESGKASLVIRKSTTASLPNTQWTVASADFDAVAAEVVIPGAAAATLVV